MNTREKLVLCLLLALITVGGLIARLRAVRMDALRAANPVRLLDSIPHSSTGEVLVDLNSASVEELDALPGIGPVLASRIVDYRQQCGPFERFEQLTNVAGIGPKRLAALKGLVRVGQIRSDGRQPADQLPVRAQPAVGAD